MNAVDGASHVSACDSSYLVLEDVNKFLFYGQDSITYNILHINCRSLPANFSSMLCTVTTLAKPLTAICVTETWLKAHNENFFPIPGYNFVSNSRPVKVGGGVGIYLDESCRYNVLQDVTIMSDIIECIFVELYIENAKNVLIGCVYRPPSAKIYEFNSQLCKIFSNKCFAKNKSLFVAGDFNINLLELESNELICNFLNIMMSAGLIPVINKPTRITSTSETLIDNIFTNCEPSKCSSALIYSDVSDHLPVLLRYNPKTFSTKPAVTKNTNYRDHRSFNQSSIESFKIFLANVDWNVIYSISNDVNLAYNSFVSIFCQGYNQHFLPKASKSTRNSPRKEWMTPGLVKCCHKKSKLFYYYKKTGSAVAKKNLLFIEIN